MNAVRPNGRSRAREAIAAVRHVFLEADHEGQQFLASLARRQDLPPPSYILHTSRNRVHVFWRVTGFDIAQVEVLQKQLARAAAGRHRRDIVFTDHPTAGILEPQTDGS